MLCGALLLTSASVCPAHWTAVLDVVLPATALCLPCCAHPRWLILGDAIVTIVTQDVPGIVVPAGSHRTERM